MTHAAEKRIQAPPDFLGSHQGLQSALHPLPRNRDRADVARAICLPTKRSTSSRRSPISEIRSWCSAAASRCIAHDIFELAEYATSRGLRTALATNGTLVTKDVAREDQGQPASSASPFRWTAPTPRPTILSAAFPAPSMPPSTACATCRSWAFRCRSTPPSRATMRTSCPACWTWRAAWAPTRCIPSCWCRWDAAWISPPSRWCRRKNTSAC